MNATAPKASPLDRNVILFILYRAFFRMRFYYPVFALFYLDARMTLVQFTWLQAIWSLSIIIFEVPSGVIADLIGRRKTLRLAGFLAIVEMIVFALSSGFWGFMVNRILSGFNESLASGADSAMVYDSLKGRGREEEYKEVLGKAQYYSLIMGAVSAVAGSYLYTINIRLPIWVTAGFMTMTFAVSLLFHEPLSMPGKLNPSAQWAMLRESTRVVVMSRQLIFLILFAFLVDVCVRIVLVHSSLYYREILIPVTWFGAIGVGIRLLNSVLSRNAYRIDRALGFSGSSLTFGVVMLVGFLGLPHMVPYAGVFFVAVLTPGMFFVAINVEGEINKRIPSERRATILSIKNMFLNLGFAAGMLLFGWVSKEDLTHGFWSLAIFYMAGALALLALGRQVQRGQG